MIHYPNKNLTRGGPFPMMDRVRACIGAGTHGVVSLPLALQLFLVARALLSSLGALGDRNIRLTVMTSVSLLESEALHRCSRN